MAALSNAVAKNQRDKDKYHEADTRVLLLLTFSRVGHLEDADRLTLRYDVPSGAPQGLLGIRPLLAQAEYERQSRRIGEALGTLKVTETRLGVTSGFDALRRELLTIHAGCLDNWCRPGETDRLHAEVGKLPLPAHLTALANTSHTLRDAQNVTRWLGEIPHPGVNARTDPQAVAALPRNLAVFPQREPNHVTVVHRLLDPLTGRPGPECDEALLLLEADSPLAESGPEHRVTAEWLLCCTLARLKSLEGVEQWLVQARVTLGRLLPDSEHDQVLDPLVRGIQGFDEQRSQMLNHSHRDDWLICRKRLAAIEAIELTSRTDAVLAADLIILPWIAGVLVPRDDRQVPLVPIPRLCYIDNTELRLGSTGLYNFL